MHTQRGETFFLWCVWEVIHYKKWFETTRSDSYRGENSQEHFEKSFGQKLTLPMSTRNRGTKTFSNTKTIEWTPYLEWAFCSVIVLHMARYKFHFIQKIASKSVYLWCSLCASQPGNKTMILCGDMIILCGYLWIMWLDNCGNQHGSFMWDVSTRRHFLNSPGLTWDPFCVNERSSWSGNLVGLMVGKFFRGLRRTSGGDRLIIFTNLPNWPCT